MTAASPTRKCPICRRPRSTEYSPFCSTRCRDRDLLQWLDGGYALPGPAVEIQDHDGDEPGA